MNKKYKYITNLRQEQQQQQKHMQEEEKPFFYDRNFKINVKDL